MSSGATADLIVVGVGAAGLATAVFAARANRGLRVACLDGAPTIGAKILVSGGGRCNVTNRDVTERDFWGGSAHVVRAVLRAFPAERTAAWFNELGVALHEEDGGKLFPDSNRARSVLDALLKECGRLGIIVTGGSRVEDVRHDGEGFVVVAQGTEMRARRVVLATGGRSLPKSGSDGFGYQLARGLGHGLVDTTPALAPLLLADDYIELSGVALPATLTLRVDGTPGTESRGRVQTRLTGPLLWTHFGLSGPVVLNASRHWLRASLAEQSPLLELNLMPEFNFETLEAMLLDEGRRKPRVTIARVLNECLPASVVSLWVRRCGIDGSTMASQMTREDRRRLTGALVETPLAVSGSRGYTYAEVTAGGIPLDEINPATMESRKRPGLYLVGEILDVDGRLGGFNFQWAWSSGYVAGTAIASA